MEMDFLKSYIPYTKENTISKGLTFAETMVSLDYNNQSKQENFLDFKEKILFCKVYSSHINTYTSFLGRKDTLCKHVVKRCLENTAITIPICCG